MACGPRPPVHTLQSDSRRTDDDDGDGDDDPVVTDYDCCFLGAFVPGWLSGGVVAVVIVCLFVVVVGV